MNDRRHASESASFDYPPPNYSTEIQTALLKITEAEHPFAFLVSEDNDGALYLSRDVATIAASQTIVPGQILSRVAVPTSVSATTKPRGDNLGNGTLTLATPTVDAAVQGGNHSVVFSDPTHFSVKDPGGVEMDERSSERRSPTS